MKKILFLLFLFIAVMLSAEWTIVQTFSIPEGASGLAFNGSYICVSNLIRFLLVS